MTKNKLAFVATSALVGSMMLASTAYAQSTGTTEVEAVVITATAGQPNIDGVITAESAPKAKATIDQEFIATQPTGQTILQSLNLTPGLNFTNNDPYGSSGGNVRLRGFDGPRISLTFDGIPLNDTGNYAIYTNQQLDPELISKASVNMGTTDVDSPTASATGGTINYTSRKPGGDMGLMLNGAAGSFNYRRVFGLVDTGEIGPWGTTAYLAGSYQKYDKFKGPGDLEKWQINGKIYQPLGDNGDFFSLAFHYNENRNNFYRTTTMANCVMDPVWLPDGGQCHHGLGIGERRLDRDAQLVGERQRRGHDDRLRPADDDGGGRPGIPNMGDCFSYATARHFGARLLFKGDDFRRTDIEPA